MNKKLLSERDFCTFLTSRSEAQTMRLSAWIIALLALLATQSFAAEPFTASCKSSSEARRYDASNDLDVVGSKLPPPHGARWSTEHWWGSDEITWNGGTELLLNAGKLRATVLDHEDDVIRATYSDAHNVYVIVLDTKVGLGVLSQQQTAVIGESRRIMARSNGLICEIRKK